MAIARLGQMKCGETGSRSSRSRSSRSSCCTNRLDEPTRIETKHFLGGFTNCAAQNRKCVHILFGASIGLWVACATDSNAAPWAPWPQAMLRSFPLSAAGGEAVGLIASIYCWCCKKPSIP